VSERSQSIFSQSRSGVGVKNFRLRTPLVHTAMTDTRAQNIVNNTVAQFAYDQHGEEQNYNCNVIHKSTKWSVIAVIGALHTLHSVMQGTSLEACAFMLAVMSSKSKEFV